MNHDELVAAYTAPGRHYHNLAHIEDCLAALARVDDLSAAEREILTQAIWWHDVVYDATRTDNEELSARLAEAYVQLSNSPPLSSSGSTGRSSIPETPEHEPRGRGVLDRPHARAMTTEYKFAFSRRDCARGLHFFPPSKTEGAGKTGCALHPRSRVQSAQQKRTRAYRFSGNTPAFPAQWLYGLLRALPGERLFCHRRPCKKLESQRNLTPAPRRQDHTTSPYASCALVVLRTPRPPHPTARP